MKKIEIIRAKNGWSVNFIKDYEINPDLDSEDYEDNIENYVFSYRVSESLHYEERAQSRRDAWNDLMEFIELKMKEDHEEDE